MSVLTLNHASLAQAICVDCSGQEIGKLLETEWLATNPLGSFCASTVCGCNTRRYHGLLIAATSPPLGRKNTLTTIMEKVTIGGKEYELATNEFDQTFQPEGSKYLVEFKNDIAPTFIYDLDGTIVTKQVLLAYDSNTVCVKYSVSGGAVELELSPFLAMRDFHHLRDNSAGLFFEKIPDGIKVFDKDQPSAEIFITSQTAEFNPSSDWWYKFRYRVELFRGQDSTENLYTPGKFTCHLDDGQDVQIVASTEESPKFDYYQTLDLRTSQTNALIESVGEDACEFEKQLTVASDAFIVDRKSSTGVDCKSVLAGFPWFADWGRDAFIALPGLLLCTKRYEHARWVFQAFADSISQGMIPNRFDDYTQEPHYNSIDASLWFIVAGERYMQETDDTDFWVNVLMPASHQILSHYAQGTRFDIHADGECLLWGGSLKTQLTWMDAALGDEVITPRHGKAVEVNALWYCAHKIMAERCKDLDKPLAKQYKHLARQIKTSFNKEFVIPHEGYLFDCINDQSADRSIRPNQIFAVSLPFSPLDRHTQRTVFNTVTEHLLTPMGLRTLSPFDPKYRKKYGGSWQSRDRAYHQGTVWAWLIGPYVEAYLKVKKHNKHLASSAYELLDGLQAHINKGCIGQISEIFDGEPPHTHRGCFAQAWSVAETLRALLLIRKYEHHEI